MRPPTADLLYTSSGGGPRLLIRQAVLAHIGRYRQKSFWSREAGGQLFGRIRDDVWTVEHVTGPRRSDFRSRFSFRPDRKAEQREIEELFTVGLHYTGDWHTHPEPSPEASATDIESMHDMVMASRHELPGFIMMIVGTAAGARGLWVSLHYPRSGWRRYSVAADTDTSLRTE